LYACGRLQALHPPLRITPSPWRIGEVEREEGSREEAGVGHTQPTVSHTIQRNKLLLSIDGHAITSADTQHVDGEKHSESIHTKSAKIMTLSGTRKRSINSAARRLS